MIEGRGMKANARHMRQRKGSVQEELSRFYGF